MATSAYTISISKNSTTSADATVLAAAIRVTDQAGPWSLPLGGHHQGSRRQFGPHVIAHGPADDLGLTLRVWLTCGEVEHGGQIEPPSAAIPAAAPPEP